MISVATTAVARPRALDSGHWVIGALIVTKLVVHLVLAGAYGWHRDELYFIECGKHLAFGYVDHAPLVPWLARLMTEIFDARLLPLRALPAVAGAGSVALAAAFAREIGGGRTAQALAALGVLIAPAYWRMGIMLNIVVFEPLFWTTGALLIARILRGASPRLWLLVGLVAGIGLLNKHTMLLWGGGIVMGFALSPARRHLAAPWPWAGGLLALLICSPNLIWQAEHGWPTLEFIRNMSTGPLSKISRALFLGGQVLYMHPVAVPLWGAGLVFLLSRRGEPYRPLGLQFLVMTAVLLLTHGKPYYLAPAYPVLLGAGGVALERWCRARTRILYADILAISGLAFSVIALPVLPLSTTDRVLDAAFGRIVPPVALTHDLHDEYGWHEQVGTVARVYHDLETKEQATATIVAGNYGEASAVNVLGSHLGLPRAVSGHMTYHLWGPDPARTSPIIAYGLSAEELALLCANPVDKARHYHPLGDEDENVAIYVCTAPRSTPAEVWSKLRWYSHGEHR